MKRMIVATFNEEAPALALKDRLQVAGLRACVKDESKLQRYGFWTSPAATEKVAVDMDDFEKAIELINAWDKTDHVLEGAIRCPQCGSPRVEFPQFTRKFVTPILVEVFVSLGLFPKEYYCQNCQYTWPKDVKPEPDRDVLGWPKDKKKAV